MVDELFARIRAASWVRNECPIGGKTKGCLATRSALVDLSLARGDPAQFLGISPVHNATLRTAQVHFMKGSATKPDSATALRELLLAAQLALLKEEMEG